jgi:hypothetical protein
MLAVINIDAGLNVMKTCRRSTPNGFYKGGSQEKQFPHGWTFSSFQPHVIKQGRF